MSDALLVVGAVGVLFGIGWFIGWALGNAIHRHDSVYDIWPDED